MSLRFVTAIALLSGCSFSGSPSTGDDTRGETPDANLIDGETGECDSSWQPRSFAPCDVNPPAEALIIVDDATYNTDTRELKLAADGPMVEIGVLLDALSPPATLLYVQEIRINEGGAFELWAVGHWFSRPWGKRRSMA